MKKRSILFNYVFKKLIAAFLGAEIVYSLIFFVQNLFILSSLIVEKNAPAKESVKLILFSLPKIFSSTMPFAVLFAALLVTFQMASNSELIALNAAGIELKKQIKPYFRFAVLVTLLYSLLLFKFVPQLTQKRDDTINKINLKSVVYSLSPGEFNRITERFYLYVGKADKNLFEKVIAFNYKNFDNFEIIYSGKAKLNLEEQKLILTLTFVDGKTYTLNSEKNLKASESYFSRKVFSVVLNKDLLTKKEPLKKKIKKLTLSELLILLKQKDKNALSVFFKRLALIFFVFLSPLLGFYTGFSLKRGAVISGAIVYGFTISFFYIFLLNIFSNLLGHNPPLGIFLTMLLMASLLYVFYINKERIEKPLVIKEKTSYFSSFKAKARSVQQWFEKKIIKQIDEKTSFSLRFPLLIRYISFDFLKYFLAFFIILQGIYLLTISLKVMLSLFKYKTNIFYGIKYIFFSSLSVYPLVIPFAFLMSALFYYVSLDESNELTAIKSSGISVFSAIMPVAYLSVIVSIILLFFTTLFSPIAKKKASELYIRINKKKKSVYLYKLKQKNKSVIRSLNNPNGFYWCDYYNFNNNEFINFISVELNFDDGNFRKLFKAKKIILNNEKIVGLNNAILIKKNENGLLDINRNPQKALIWDSLSFFKQIEPLPDEMTQFELRNFISRKKSIGIKPYNYITNYYYRFSSAFSPFVLLLLGLPFALINEGRKKKPIAGIGIALMLVVLYYSLTSLFLSFGAKHYLPSFLAAWFTNIIFMLTGIYLFTKIKT